MLNSVTLVGRISENLPKETITKENGEKYVKIKLSIPRAEKDSTGNYITDNVEIILKDMLAKNAVKFLNKGDMCGIKGRVENEDNQTVIEAEKMTFLSKYKE